jgi:hypothetical protein
MKKEEILNNIGSGWHRYIELIYNMSSDLSFATSVVSIERKNGMLHVKFLRDHLTLSTQEFILSSIEYRLERITAKICEECGLYGYRRTNLPETKTLCTKCYALEYSILNPTPSLVAHHKPHNDY